MIDRFCVPGQGRPERSCWSLPAAPSAAKATPCCRSSIAAASSWRATTISTARCDPLVAHTAAGRRKVPRAVNDLTMSGGKGFDYRLTIGELPYVIGCYPLSVPADRGVASRAHRLQRARRETKVKRESRAKGEVAVPIDADKFRGRRDLKVVVSARRSNRSKWSPMTAPQQRDAESLHRAAQTAASRRGRPTQPADVDHYRFEAKKGQQWIIETIARRRGSPVDTRIDVLDADGQPIERLLLQAVRDSLHQLPHDQLRADGRAAEELGGDGAQRVRVLRRRSERLFRAPQGPDSDSLLYESTPGCGERTSTRSATAHANYDPAYIVEPHQPGTKLAFNGLPVVPAVLRQRRRERPRHRERFARDVHRAGRRQRTWCA